MDYMKQFFSLEEKKISALIVALIVFCGLGGWQVIKYGDMSPNLVNFLIALVAAIASVNAVERWSSRSNYGGYQQNYLGEDAYANNRNQPPI